MRYRYIFLIVAFLISDIAFSQMNIAVGDWRTHLAYNSTSQIAVSPDKVYGLSTGSLFSFSKEDLVIETYSKITNLSDNNIHKIFYLSQEQALFIGYDNGNIDFIFDDGQIFNLPDIYNKNIAVDKQVNDVLYFDGYLYLATPFGVVKINVKRHEIADTYYFIDEDNIYLSVLSILVYQDSFYALLDNNKVLSIPSRGKNLANMSNWKDVSGIPSKNSVKAIAFGQEVIFLHSDSTASTFDGSSWQYDKYTGLVDVCYNDDVLFLIKPNSIKYNDQTLAFDYQPRMAYYDKTANIIWLASINNGIGYIDIEDTSTRGFYNPIGPVFNEVWRLRFAQDRLFVVAGGRWDVPYGSYGNVMIYENNSWYNISHADIYNEIGARGMDFVDIAVDKNDKRHFFVASAGSGLFEFKDDKALCSYDYNNSAIDGRLVENVVIDNANNIWISNPQSLAFIKRAKASNYGEYLFLPFSGTSSDGVKSVSDVLIDKFNENYKYVVVARGDTKFVAIDDNGTDYDGDNKIVRVSQFIDQDGKVFKAEHYMCGIQDPFSGSLWIGTTSGPVILPNPRNIFNANYRCKRVKIPRDDGSNFADYLLENEVITAIAVDGNGCKWMGTEGSGVYLLSEDGTTTLQHFTVDNSPILSNFVRTIAINHSTGEVFIGTNKGIISYMGNATQAEESYVSLHSYPNPVRPDYQGDIIIKGLAENSTVKITDARGNLVFQTTVRGGSAAWNGLLYNGSRAASGTYIAFCNTQDGKHGIAKILIIN